MSAINAFLVENNLRIAQNPCISPDFCLDWHQLEADILAKRVYEYPKSRFTTAAGEWTLLENELGDCAWKLQAIISPLDSGTPLPHAAMAFPATWVNLLKLKNLIQEYNADSTIFPTAGARLGRSTIGVGARFTTLHWPAVEWAMSALEIGVTANQNSIPRELVFDVDAMLDNRLDTVPFPFIGTSVPEGHQGQSVEGMSHGAVISKLKSGFHHRKIAWSFNADHQPIGGRFDAREDALVRGCLLASYITFDLSPELAQTKVPENSDAWVTANIPSKVIGSAQKRLKDCVNQGGLSVAEVESVAGPESGKLLAYVWPALLKMKRRDEKYAAARAAAFTTEAGRRYLRELSIDELPGLTAPGTTAVMLALCEALDMPVNFVAPAFGFQKNTPYPDSDALRVLIQKQWDVCAKFGVSIGFHSGSGKSAENYRVMGEVTGGALEIKTSGRYTYEMGVALAASKQPADQALWRDWYGFTLEMALAGAFSADETEQRMARLFITTSLENDRRTCSSGDPEKRNGDTSPPKDVFVTPEICRAALESLSASPDHMFFFEYNFLSVLAAGGRAEKAALGDHTLAGYAQRARFYAISSEARLNYAKGVAGYLVFLAEHTGLVPAVRCAAARKLLAGYDSYDELFDGISR